MGETPFERRLKKQGIGRGGRASEKRVAKIIGAKTTPASGAIEAFKGDMRKANFLIEAKSTKNDSLGLKFDWLVKISKEARDSRRKPAMTISFTTDGGRELPNGEWALIPMSLFRELVEDL